MTAAGIQLPDIGTKTFAVAVDKNHPDGEMTSQEKTKFIQKVKDNYIKEINGILNEKWQGTDQKTGQVVISLGSELGKYKGDIKRTTTAIQEMSNQALTKSWTNAYKEMGLEKGATTEYKWEKIGDVLFDNKSINENDTLKKLKDSGINFNNIEAKSDIKIDKGEMTNEQYETYKKEYKERALLEIDEVLTIPQLRTEYLEAAKKNIPTGEYVSGLEELNKIKVIKNNKEISLLQDKINEALSGLKRKILIDMGLITPEKSWKKATDIPDLDRTIEQ
jgi:ribosome recycling factor